MQAECSVKYAIQPCAEVAYSRTSREGQEEGVCRDPAIYGKCDLTEALAYGPKS